ncbi:hypothetical protein BDV95DRAFT_274136 [Massariosphaeria phaeospora]|uniref:Homeobox domain-containing protein n=1 Tax=Massariosphaeria phaeospora TaxID=100035 RepID=A0A7C8MF76_9PLEO|nr:hypothetical protein BDV95DRAFT_274136 [Massariosphaeria phaeospora]
MLSPDSLSPKASAPSIWSFDSGYASNSVAEDEFLQLPQAQPADPLPSSSRLRFHPDDDEREHVRSGGFWSMHVGQGRRGKREEPAIDPIVTKLSVYTTTDNRGNDFLLPEISGEGRACLTCEFLNVAYAATDLRCDECQVPDIIDPARLLLVNCLPKDEERLPRHGISQEPNGKALNKSHPSTRCTACELSALIDPTSTSSCPSCSPNADLLSPLSPLSPSTTDFRVRRSRAGRNSKLPLTALNRLQAWLEAHQENPYPSAETKHLLAQECGITEKQVTTWFTNARARQLTPLDTWLSSGSEDDGARESDIASAANTPAYTGGFAFISDQRPVGHRHAGSVSGSSAFSATQARPQPSRRGKKKNYRRNNQPPQINELDSQTPNTSNSLLSHHGDQPEQETWPCTFCRKNLVPKSWRRHEETQHRPRTQWTCMLYGPRLSFPARSNSSSGCAFCMIKDPSEDHFLLNHRISECAKRPIGDRTFFRPDHLRQHVKNFHGATLFDIVQGRWKRAAEVVAEGWTCGFCGENLENWGRRETHIANHFKEGLTMESWRESAEPGQGQTQNQVRKEGDGTQRKNNVGKQKEKEKEPHLPHTLARLGRSLTRRSTRRAEPSYHDHDHNTEPHQDHQNQPHPPTHRHVQASTHTHPLLSNPFAAFPTSTSAPTYTAPLGLSNSATSTTTAPILPDINLDPLITDSTPSYLDWCSGIDTMPAYPLAMPNVFDASSVPTDFDSALDMDLYGNEVDYQGGWGYGVGK